MNSHREERLRAERLQKVTPRARHHRPHTLLKVYYLPRLTCIDSVSPSKNHRWSLVAAADEHWSDSTACCSAINASLLAVRYAGGQALQKAV